MQTQAPSAATTVPVPANDVQVRIVNGILVVGVVGIVGVLYTYQVPDASMFGTFTTLVGTALSAYFGISATREVSRNAVDSSNQQVADAHQKLGQLKDQHDAATAKLAAVNSVVGPAPAMNAPEPTLAQLRTILSQ
jgi:hypothetical protein